MDPKKEGSTETAEKILEQTSADKEPVDESDPIDDRLQEEILQELFNKDVEYLVPIFSDLFFEGDTTYLCPHYFIAERIIPLFQEMEERLGMEKEEIELHITKASKGFEPEIWKEIESYLSEPFYCQIVSRMLPIREDFFHQIWNSIVDTFLLVGVSREELYKNSWGYFSVEEMYKLYRHEYLEDEEVEEDEDNEQDET